MVDFSLLGNPGAQIQNQMQNVVNTGLMIKQGREQKALQEQALADQERFRTDSFSMIDKIRDKSLTAEDILEFQVRNPGAQDIFTPYLDRMDEAEKAATASSVVNLIGLIEAGQTDKAKEMLQEKIVAAENAGLEGVDVDGLAGALQMLELGEEGKDGVLFSLYSMLPGLQDGEKLTQVMDNLRRRDSDLALQGAQAKKATAEAGKITAETRKLVEEMDAVKSGDVILEGKDLVSKERELRNDFLKNTAEYDQLRRQVEVIRNADLSGPGAIATVVSFMKMIDPGSVVREGEFATAENSAGVPERIRNIYNSLVKGDTLSQTARDAFVSQSDKILDQSRKDYNSYKNLIENSIKGTNLRREAIFKEEPQARTLDDVMAGL